MKTFVSRPVLAAFLCYSFASMVLPNLAFAESFDFPQDSRMWVNSPPVSLASMEGKAIVLYFFEEGCPTCQAKWPEILQAATQMRSQPVMLIGVNSGTPPAEIAQYIVREFDGYELPESVATELAKLKGDHEIRRQIDAAKQWIVAQRSIASGTATPARTKAILSKLIEKYPGTEAAEMAQVHIDP